MGGYDNYAQRAAENKQDIAVSLVFEMIGYKDDAPNTQSMPVGFDLVFPELAEQLEENEYRADFIAFVAEETAFVISKSLESYADLLGLAAYTIGLTKAQSQSPALRDLRRSDHAAFWAEGYPAIMIGDTANFRYDAYHCTSIMDEVFLLDHDFAVDVIKTTVGPLVEELGGL